MEAQQLIEAKEANYYQIKYIHLTPEVFMNKKLDKTCCILFALIQGLDDAEKHCWASNQYFSELLGLSTTTISTSISVLIEEGYVEKVLFDGKKRIIKICEDYQEKHRERVNELNKRNSDFNDPLRQPLSPFKDSLQDLLKDNIIYNIIDDINNCKQLLPPAGKPTKGLLSEFIDLRDNRPDTYERCEEIFDYWSQFGQPLTVPIKNFSNPTKSLQEAFIIISKELQRLPKDKIKEAMYFYYQMLVDTDTYDLNCEDPLHLVDIINFFKFSHFLKKKQLSAKSNNPAKDIKSWYWECAQGLGHLEKYKRKKNNNGGGRYEIIEDKYPEITAGFQDVWRHKARQDSWYSFDEEKHHELFKKASIFLIEFIDKWGRRLGEDGSLPSHEDIYGGYVVGYVEKPQTLIYDFIAALDMTTEGMSAALKITPGWLSTPAMEDRLIQYYKFHGCLSDD